MFNSVYPTLLKSRFSRLSELVKQTPKGVFLWTTTHIMIQLCRGRGVVMLLFTARVCICSRMNKWVYFCFSSSNLTKCLHGKSDPENQRERTVEQVLHKFHPVHRPVCTGQTLWHMQVHTDTLYVYVSVQLTQWWFALVFPQLPTLWEGFQSALAHQSD